MKKFDFKKVLQHVIAIIVFVLLTVIYFEPIVFENKGLLQSDAISGLGMGNDSREYHKQTGDYTHWSNAMFGGMPANYAYMPGSTNIFKSIANLFTTIFYGGTAGLVFLYLLGFYILFIAIGCKPWLSVVGAIAFAFCSYNLIIIEAGHVNKGLVMATMAPVIGGVMLCYRKKYLWGALITLFFTGLNAYWNHQQISYYLLIILLVLAIVYLIYAIIEHTVKDYLISSTVLIGVALLAILPAAGQLLPAMDYTKETMRGGAVLETKSNGEKESSGLEIDYAYAWSYGVGESMTLLIPNMYGASSHYNIGNQSNCYEQLKSTGQAAQFCKGAPTYWGPQPFTSGPVYMGAIICFLFLFGLIVVQGKDKWWLLAVTIISLILAWGKYFPAVNNFLFYHLPLYNKFRAPSMALVMASVTMVIMAILSIKEITSHKNDAQKRNFYMIALFISGGIIGALCLFLASFGSVLFSFSGATDAQLPDWLIGALKADRQQMLASDAWRSFIFIALAFAAIWYYLKKGFNTTILTLLLGVLILVDLWDVDKRFLNWDSFVSKKKATEIVATEADKLILQDKDPDYRVLNLASNTFNESMTSYFHKSVGGYSPAKLRRYQDIIDYYFSGKLNMSVLNMLNTRYVIVAGQDGKAQVQRNTQALGNAWFVNEVVWVDTPNQEIESLSNFDPSQTAFIHQEWKDEITNSDALNHSKDSLATIRLTDYKNPGYLVYESESTQPHLAVFSEVFYKTWKAYIDGKEVPVVRVNYILRGLEVPAGKHEIEFKCVDEVIVSSGKISLYSSIFVGLVMVLLIGGIIYQWLKKMEIIA